MSMHAIVQHLRRQVASSRPDAELLRAYADERDQDAFRTLTERYGALVLGFCRRHLRDDAAADDAVQETFLLLSQRPAVVHADALPAWLFGVARRICAHARRADQRRHRRESAAAQPSIHFDANELSVRELLVVVDEEVARLPERPRAALLACFWQGLPQAEAARRLGTTPDAVRGLLERGRAKLLARLQRRGLTADVALPSLLAGAAVTALPSELLARTLARAGLAAVAVPKVGMLLAWGSAVALLLAGAGLWWAPTAPRTTPTQPPGNEKNAARDADDPLPPAALLRLGTMRFRPAIDASALALSPDERFVATGGQEWLAVTETATGKLLWRQRMDLRSFNYAYRALVFSPDNQKLFTINPKDGLCVWDVATGNSERLGADLKGIAVDVAPDGKRLAIGRSDGVIVCDLRGETICQIAQPPSTQPQPRPPLANRNQVWTNFTNTGPTSLGQFSPDGQLLVVAFSGVPDSVQLCDAATGRELRKIPLGERVIRLAFAPDGKSLATTERDHAVRLYDTATGKRLHSWQLTLGVAATTGRATEYASHYDNPEHQYTTAVTFSPDGKTVAAGASDHAIHLWDAASGQPLGQLKSFGLLTPWGLAFQRDGRSLIAVGWDGTIQTWDVLAQKLRPLDVGVRANGVVAAAPHGRTLAYAGGDGSIRLVDASTGNELRKLQPASGEVGRLAFSPDGRYLAEGGNRGERAHYVHLWDVQRGDGVRLWDAPNAREPMPTVQDLSFSPDGRQLAAVLHEQNEVRLFDLANKRNRRLPEQGVRSVAFSPDGQTLVTCGRSRPTLHFWDVATLEQRGERELAPANVGHSYASLQTVRYSPDGRLLAAALTLPAEVRVLDAHTLKEISVIKPGSDSTALAFSPDSLRLACGSYAGPISVWEPHSGRKLWERGRHSASVRSLSYGRDSRALLSGGEDGVGYWWNVRPESVPAKGSAALWADLRGADVLAAESAFWALVDRPNEAIALLPQVIGGAIDRHTLQRATSVLWHIGTPAAKAVFQTWAKAGGELSELASAALRRFE